MNWSICSSASTTDPASLWPVWKLDQVAYVVRNMEVSLPAYEKLHGPFELAEYPLEAVSYRGRMVDCRLKVATNNDGPLEIELVEVMEGQTPHSEHIERYGEGLHHIRFRVDRIDERITNLEAEGYETVFYKRIADDIAFAYLEAPSGGILELLDMP